MPRIERTAEIAWEGNLARGAGTITAGSSGAFAGLAYTNASRIGDPEGKTSPEELLAAAHGGCFTTSLAGELTRLGHPPGRLEVSCRIVMDEVEGQGHQIVGSRVTASVVAERLDAATLAEATRLADEGCPFSALLKRAGAAVEVQTTLGLGV
jgi:osmotically inducible protein OsmC